MRSWLRILLALVAAGNLVLAAGYALQLPWAIGTWPWETGRLSYLFIASILAAISAGAGWIAWSAETGSLPAGFLNLTITLGGISAYLFLTATEPDRGTLLPYAIGAGVLAAANLVAFGWTLRVSAPVAAPTPRLVRGSYVAFTAILVAVGLALILRTPGVMPWPLDPDTSVVIGWIFLGDAFYFLYAVLRPRWDAARAQLWSFLAYDVVLVVPLMAHYPAAPPELRTNVLVYSAVLVYSGALAVYYLFIDVHTRGWGSAAEGTPPRPTPPANPTRR